MGSLLIVDDEPDILETLEELFKYESGLEIDVHVANSARAAVELLEQSKFCSICLWTESFHFWYILRICLMIMR